VQRAEQARQAGVHSVAVLLHVITEYDSVGLLALSCLLLLQELTNLVGVLLLLAGLGAMWVEALYSMWPLHAI